MVQVTRFGHPAARSLLALVLYVTVADFSVITHTARAQTSRAAESQQDATVAFGKAIAAALDGSLTAQTVGELRPMQRGDLLSYFANRDDPALIKRLIGLGIAPDEANSYGTNALIVAIGTGSLRSAGIIVASGGDVHAKTSRGTPIDYAKVVGSVEINMLLRDGKLPDQGAMLRLAARTGNTDEIKHLISAGAFVGAADADGVTPLLEACIYGQIPAVKLLLDLDANPNGVPGSGAMPPLAASVAAGDIDTVKLLLEHGADPNVSVRGVPVLTLAVISGSATIIDRMLADGALPTMKGDAGLTPADVAMLTDQAKLTQRLGGSQFTHQAQADLFVSLRINNAAMVRSAIERGVNPNVRNDDDYPAIIYAALYSKPEIFDELVSLGAGLFGTAPDLSTVIHAAYARPDKSTADAIATRVVADLDPVSLERLLRMQDKHGRSAAVVLAGQTRHEANANPLRLALMKLAGHDMSLLANAADADGTTPLQAAVLTDNGQAVKAFVESGANTKVRMGDVSLQEVARARRAWHSLRYLPSDRVMPDGIGPKTDIGTRKELQSRLKEWGYYHGAIDGVLGGGTRAATIAFLKQRKAELKKIFEAFSANQPKRDDAKTTFDVQIVFPGDTCRWLFVEWKAPKKNEALDFVGCVAGKKSWYSDGIGYFTFANGTDELALYGDDPEKNRVVVP